MLLNAVFVVLIGAAILWAHWLLGSPVFRSGRGGFVAYAVSSLIFAGLIVGLFNVLYGPPVIKVTHQTETKKSP